MEEERYIKMYRRLYRLFRNTTPLKVDCGAVCGGECCKGDENTGMLLFPHEQTALRVLPADGRRYAVCGGTCDRGARPLSCRIFPFFPLVAEDGSLEIVPDARGYAVCPLVRQAENVRFSPRFLRHMKKAAKILQKDPACAAFLREVSDEIREAAALQAELAGEASKDIKTERTV